MLANKDLAEPCHQRIIPVWLVLLDNVPTLLLFVLGFLIINQLSLTGAIVYGIYAISSVVWFWARICPYCHHYDTFACPCGYGVISARIFKRRDSKHFKRVFRRNIIVQFPNWFAPFSVALYLLIVKYSTSLLLLTIIFSIIGFVIIPIISKQVGCKNCEIKDDCPWMTISKQR